MEGGSNQGDVTLTAGLKNEERVHTCDVKEVVLLVLDSMESGVVPVGRVVEIAFNITSPCVLRKETKGNRSVRKPGSCVQLEACQELIRVFIFNFIFMPPQSYLTSGTFKSRRVKFWMRGSLLSQ
jgi:hypothetical protein